MYGYRKFVVTLIAILSSDFALYLDKVNGVEWATLVAGLVGGFMAINALKGTKQTKE